MDSKPDPQHVETAEAMKRFPHRAPHRNDFHLSETEWDRDDFTPQDLVNIVDYKHELFWDNIAHTFRTGERRPSFTYLSRMMEELGLSEDEFEKIIFAGDMVKYDRELMAMTDEELEEHFRPIDPEELERAMNDPEIPKWEDFVARNEAAKAEREQLENLWNMSEGESE